MSKTYIGIDIGKTGAICILQPHENKIEIHKMPATPADVVALLYPVIAVEGIGNVRCAVEKQQSGGFGGMKVGVTSMFNFGMGYGIIQGVLAGMHMPFILVPPKTWQKELGALPKDKPKRKTEILMRMQSMYPQAKIYKYAADAVAIAEYATRHL
jgi:crossover junction endodeoxyribonuclease RuvC